MSEVHELIDINLTDLSFANRCLEVYGINRGIYNTIDFWFYENGIKEIKLRRKIILNFLECVCIKNSKRTKFGNGGLTSALTIFLKGASVHKRSVSNAKLNVH
ncbi:hypothetical protein [Alkalihalobacillus deserti]|uniref:hypothetical protein n=1 Tax=Alkalihalobacillus deserti TaxID=2879466 RepID=UPI001D13B2C9|nr:hypothetical protein [Alkalihalobacillus deserti]